MTDCKAMNELATKFRMGKFSESKTQNATPQENAQKGFPPGLFLIGAQKCATTFLAECLAAHVSVELASPKEPDYFTRHADKGLEWYAACFRNQNDKYLLDASTSYSVFPYAESSTAKAGPRSGVPGRIYGANPRAQIIYVVRDPIQRAYASYWHSVRRGEEDRSFLDAIDHADWYLDGSRYYHQLRQYMKYFSPEQIYVVSMKAFIQDPQTTVTNLLHELGIPDPTQVALDTSHRNKSVQLPPLVSFAAKYDIGYRVLKTGTRAVKRVLPRPLYNTIRGTLGRSIPPMSEAEYSYVYERLENDIVNFEELTGLTLVEAGVEPDISRT